MENDIHPDFYKSAYLLLLSFEDQGLPIEDDKKFCTQFFVEYFNI